jgi:hypothetical protein
MRIWSNSFRHRCRSKGGVRCGYVAELQASDGGRFLGSPAFFISLLFYGCKISWFLHDWILLFSDDGFTRILNKRLKGRELAVLTGCDRLRMGVVLTRMIRRVHGNPFGVIAPPFRGHCPPGWGSLLPLGGSILRALLPGRRALPYLLAVIGLALNPTDRTVFSSSSLQFRPAEDAADDLFHLAFGFTNDAFDFVFRIFFHVDLPSSRSGAICSPMG